MLFRTCVNGASNHVLRACFASQERRKEHDTAPLAFVEGLFDTTLDSTQCEQALLYLKHGGLGFASARLRWSAAYLASWEQGFRKVARLHGHTSAQALLAQVPQVAGAIDAASADLRVLGVWR